MKKTDYSAYEELAIKFIIETETLLEAKIGDLLEALDLSKSDFEVGIQNLLEKNMV